MCLYQINIIQITNVDKNGIIKSHAFKCSALSNQWIVTTCPEFWPFKKTHLILIVKYENPFMWWAAFLGSIERRIMLFENVLEFWIQQWLLISETNFFNELSLRSRVFVATWNLEGKVPCNGLNLDEWLHISDPTNIYILGCQQNPFIISKPSRWIKPWNFFIHLNFVFLWNWTLIVFIEMSQLHKNSNGTLSVCGFSHVSRNHVFKCRKHFRVWEQWSCCQMFDPYSPNTKQLRHKQE